jgi:hypothetical protein
MQRFSCRGCGSALYFGNRQCLGCGRQTGYLPEVCTMVALDPDDAGNPVPLEPRARPGRWLHCAHRFNGDACFWLVDQADGRTLCRSCRLSTLIPDLTDFTNLARWKRVEAAKQWLIHSLLELNLPFEDPVPGAAPLEFHLLAAVAGESVTTGHEQGVITIDVAEADDAERARRRTALGEPYRTLLGHLRHEVGHYYWQVLSGQPGFLAEFRRLFGDEQADYAKALQRHYEHGAPADWQAWCVSAYASSHPWEDWAECWAHFLHVVDAVDSARAHDLRFGAQPVATDQRWPPEGDVLLDRWHPVSLLINDLNRAVGMPDAYPFVVSDKVREKIAYVSRQVQRLAALHGNTRAGRALS